MMRQDQNQGHVGPPPVMIVGGTSEAQALAGRLGTLAQIVYLVRPRLGFDAAGAGSVVTDLTAQCRARGARFLVDGTHPCDRDGGLRVVATARQLQLPVMRLERPGWQAGRGDRWHWVRDPRSLRFVIPRGARVLATTGRDGLVGLAQLQDVALWVRQVSDGGARARIGRRLTGPAPFTVAQEMRMMRQLALTWLVLRDAGGSGGWPKLAAARRLGVRVAVIRRPARGCVPTVRDVAQAEERIHRWLALHP